MRVNRDDHADLVLGQAPPAGPPRLALDAGALEVHLVGPDAARQHDLVLPPADRGERLVAPEEGGVEADLVGQLDEAQRGVVAHDLDNPRDLVQRQLGGGEDGAGEGAKPPAAHGHRWRFLPAGVWLSSHAASLPHVGQVGSCPHLASSPSIVSVPYFSRHNREAPASLSSSAERPSTRERRSREPLPMRSSDILGSRLGGHLPRCRQTKKKVTSQVTLFCGAIVSRSRLVRHPAITTFVDTHIWLFIWQTRFARNKIFNNYSTLRPFSVL